MIKKERNTSPAEFINKSERVIFKTLDMGKGLMYSVSKTEDVSNMFKQLSKYLVK